MKAIIFMLLVALLTPIATHADVWIKQKRHTDAYQAMGQSQPAKDEIIITWMSKDKMRIDQGADTTMLVDMSKSMMYTITHANKSYFEMPISDLGTMAQSAAGGKDQPGDQQAQMQEMIKKLTANMKTTVTDTGETKKIKNWNAKKYTMKMEMGMGTTESEMWTTEDVKVDYTLYNKMKNAVMSKDPSFQASMKEMEKIKGLPVMSNTTSVMMGTTIKNTEEVEEIAEKDAPAGAYEIPKDYKKTEGFGKK